MSNIVLFFILFFVLLAFAETILEFLERDSFYPKEEKEGGYTAFERKNDE